MLEFLFQYAVNGHNVIAANSVEHEEHDDRVLVERGRA